MIIGIDGNEANVSTRVGIGQYAFNLLTQINRLDKTNDYLVYLKHPPLADMPPTTKHWHYQVFGPTKAWTYFALPFHLFTQTPPIDLFFTPSHYLPRFCPCPAICSIMDLGYLSTPDQFTPHDYHQLTTWTARSIKSAVHLITISQFTRNEIIKNYHYPAAKITIASPGVTPPVKIKPFASVSTKFKIDQPYFIFVGTLKPSKNIPFLLTAFARFLQTNQKGSNYKLVIAGKKGWLYADIFKLVTDLQLQAKIIFTDFFTEAEKWTLIQNSQALIIPSLYEGFGIPAIEAMAVGTPVIGSNIASLPEIIGQSGILVDPTDVSELTQALVQISDRHQRQKFVKLGLNQVKNYSWAHAGQTVIDVFNHFKSPHA